MGSKRFGMCFVEGRSDDSGVSRMASIGTTLEIVDFAHVQVRLLQGGPPPPTPRPAHGPLARTLCVCRAWMACVRLHVSPCPLTEHQAAVFESAVRRGPLLSAGHLHPTM